MEDEFTDQETQKFNEIIEKDIKIVSKLEDYFCCSPDFSHSINTFFEIECCNFKESFDNEHTIQNFDIYKKYCIELEKVLECFLTKENIKGEELILACSRVKEIDENSMTCLDYLLAGADYPEFYYLMMEFKKMYTYEEKNTQNNNNFEFYLEQKSSINIIDNSGAKIINNKADEEIVEEIIIEKENKLKTGKK